MSDLISREQEERNMKTTIICGFPGIGKTTCRYKYNNPNVLDMESSAYSWIFDCFDSKECPKRNPEFPKNYIDSLELFANKGGYEYIFVSCRENEMRLIDADALIGEINERIEAAIKWGVNAIADRDKKIKLRAEQAVATFCEASLTAKKMPSIDAVEVVRCRNCECWYSEEDGEYGHCRKHDFWTFGGWFCADGEER